MCSSTPSGAQDEERKEDRQRELKEERERQKVNDESVNFFVLFYSHTIISLFIFNGILFGMISHTSPLVALSSSLIPLRNVPFAHIFVLVH